MYKVITGCALVILFYFTSCAEEEMDLRGTSPTIKLSFYKDAKSIKPDSVYAVGADSIHVFTDTLQAYVLPLRSDQDSSEFTFYLDTLVSDVKIIYSRIPGYDIDVIRHNTVFKNASASHPDSIVLVYDNDKICLAKEPSETKNVALNCGDTLNLKTHETTLRLYY